MINGPAADGVPRRPRRRAAVHARRRGLQGLAVGPLGGDPQPRGRARHHAVRPHHPPGRADRRRTRPAPLRAHHARPGGGRARRRGARDARAVGPAARRRRAVPRHRRRRRRCSSDSVAGTRSSTSTSRRRARTTSSSRCATASSTWRSSRPTDHLTGMTRTELGRRPLVLLCPPEHPLARSARVDWAELRDLDFIDFQESWAVRSAQRRRVRRARRRSSRALHGQRRAHAARPRPARPRRRARARSTSPRSRRRPGSCALQLPPTATPQWVVSAVTGSPAAASAPLLLEILDGELRPTVRHDEAAGSAGCRRGYTPIVSAAV